MNSYRRPSMTLGNQFANLYFSARDLVERFGVTQDTFAAWHKFEEEILELDAALDEIGANDKGIDAIAEEAVDVMVTLINVLRAAGVPTELFVEKMRDVWVKNDKKDDSTHVVHNGLITRRSKLENNGNE